MRLKQSPSLKNRQALSRYVKFDEDSQKYFRIINFLDLINEDKFNELV
jgi:hypothetical protein